jgi:uncharacterized lipoprotein YmbA
VVRNNGGSVGYDAMKIRSIRWLASTCLFLTLTACGTSTSVRYYSMEPITVSDYEDADDAVVLGLGPLRVPDYLSRTQIVTRISSSEVHVDEFNRWAEPIDDAIYRNVAASVDGQVDGLVVVGYPFSNAIDYDYQLTGRIDRFDVDQDGSAVLAVQWTVAGTDAKIMVPLRRSRYEAQVTRQDDMNSVARAMSDCLGQFSREIAGEFERDLAENKD